MQEKPTNNYKDILVTWIKENLHAMKNPPTSDEVDTMDNTNLENLADRIEMVLK